MTSARRLSPHLSRLESEAIFIIREVAAEFRKPVLLYSVGKDSSVLAHLARKAFFPSPLPFPLLHVDTTWKFREMIAFRDGFAKRNDLTLIVHVNREALASNPDPCAPDPGLYTRLMKTEALKQALQAGGFDAALGGARRDEDRSRAKERIFSHRDRDHVWEPSNQRPELWRVFNTRIRDGETMRVFPLSNWTELDVWEYISAEGIAVVPLYFACLRTLVDRGGMLILRDDGRMKVRPADRIVTEQVRFRTLGCYPLTAAVRSTAETVEQIIQELKTTSFSERQGRLIDLEDSGSLERKKREGYF